MIQWLLAAAICLPFLADGAQVFSRHVPNRAAHTQALGRLPATNRVDVTIALPLRNTSELSDLLRDLYDPATPRYHQFLTPDQFAERFGPSENDYRALAAFAQSHGLQVVERHSNRTLLHLAGAARDIEQAFHVALQTYRHPDEHRLFYAPDKAPSLDTDVPVLDVRGLENYELPRPAFQARPITPDSPSLATGSGPGGTYLGSDFRRAYAPGVTLTGAGQTLALFEMDGYYTNDIVAYETLAGLPSVTLSNVLLGGFSGIPSDPYLVIEPSLDIQLALAMAPGLERIMVYEAPLSSVGAYDILNRMATDNAAKQISSSWTIDSIVTNPVPNQIYQQFAAQGQSFFQASGDQGAFYPGAFQFADNPYLTIVGGTALTTTGPAGTWSAETTWPLSGGGISTVFPVPSYQQGLATWLNRASATMRNVPDVALTADNVLVIAQTNLLVVGGTSCAAPLWAGFTALMNQQAAANGRSPVGFLNPSLYALGQQAGYSLAFHDITTGGNGNIYYGPWYYAVPGYDLCTGWGTPNGKYLIDALVPAADALQISPGLGFAVTASAGGYVVGSQTYSLKNGGTTAIPWTLINTSAWLNVSATSGQVAAGGLPGLVTVSVNTTANSLPDGNYAATIWFTNLNDGVGQPREFFLQIYSAPPVIYYQPAIQKLLAGQTAVFSVAASGSALRYNWLKNGVPLADGGRITGSGTSTLMITGATFADVGTYSVTVANAAGSVDSSPAALVLYPAAAANLLANGGFETGDFSGWTLSGNTNLTAVTGNGFAVHAGAYGAQFGSSGALTYLSQTIPTVPGAMYAVSAWLDSPSPLIPSELIVQWDGTTLVDSANLGALNWTNLQFILTASTSNTTLIFGFRDDPSYLTLDDVSVSQITNVLSPPLFTRQPLGQQVTLGSPASFAVTASGTAPLGYRWRFNGTNISDGSRISGAATSTLTISNITAADLGLYSVVISNLYGSTTSLAVPLIALLPGAATLTFDDLPSAGWVPSGYGGVGWNGLTVASSLAYSNANGLSGFCAGVISGTNAATNPNGYSAELSSLTGPFNLYSAYLTAAWNDGLQLLVLGYNGPNTLAYSNVYTLSTTDPLLIPFNFTNVTDVTFISSGGVPHPGYNRSGNDFVLDNVTVSLAGPVVLTSQPASQLVTAGSPAAFSATAVGALPVTFQWQKNGLNLSDNSNCSGTRTPMLTISNAASADAGLYSVVVSNLYGSVASTGAVLSVATVAATNLVVNGGFETGDFTGWTLSGSMDGTFITTNLSLVHSGAYAAEFASSSTTYLGQSLPTTPGAQYLVTFALNCLAPNSYSSLSLFWDGFTLLDQVPVAVPGWTNVQIVITATNSHTLLQFALFSGYAVFGLDDIAVWPLSTLAAPPVVTRQPIAQAVPLETTAAFSVKATGSELTYQWQCDGTNLLDGGNLVGTTTPTLTLINVSATNQGLYSVIVSNAFGAAVSMPAPLTLLPAGTLVITFDDLPETSYGLAITNGYFGFNWNGLSEIDGLTASSYQPVAQTAVVSPNNVAYNGYYVYRSGFSSPVPFTLYSAYLTSTGISDSSPLIVLGYAGGALRYSNSYSFSNAGPTLLNFNCSNVTEIEFLATPAYSTPVFFLDNVAVAFSGPPWIAAQPASQQVFQGMPAQFSVMARGSAPLTYQWRKNGVDLLDAPGLSGTRTAKLTFANVSLADAGVYSVVVSNPLGTITTAGAALTVYSVGTGNLLQNGGFETGDFTGWTLTGNTKSSYVSDDPAYLHSGHYGAQLGPYAWYGDLSQYFSGTTPNSLYLVSFWLAGLPPAGGYSSFYAFWNGSPLLDQYGFSGQQLFGWTNLQVLVVANSSTATLDFECENDFGYFALDDISVTPIVGVAGPPAIVTQPHSQALPAGATATLSAFATGSDPMSYQWLRNGTNLFDGGPLSGTTSSSLVISDIGPADAGAYSVVVTNPYGLATSLSATLSVVQLAPAQQMITFDDLPNGYSGQPVPNGYAGMNWAGFFAYDALSTTSFQPTAQAGMLSPRNVAIGVPGYYSPLSFSSTNGLFNLVSAWLTAYNTSPVAVLGYAGSTLLYSNLLALSTTAPTLVNFNFTNISSVAFAMDFYSYNAVIMDNLVMATNTASAPIISRQPTNQSVVAGGSAGFNVGVLGSEPLSFQWLLNGHRLTDDSNFSGTTTAQLTISNAAVAQVGAYSVLVTNGFGTAASSAAGLAVFAFATSNLVQNGGFETGDFTGWQQSGDPKNVYVSTNAPYAHSGRFGAQLGPVSTAEFSQAVPTSPGLFYRLSFWLDFDALGSCWVYWGGNYVFNTSSWLSPGWTNLQFTVPAYDMWSTLRFSAQDGPGYLGLDDISVVGAEFLTPPATPVQIEPPQLANGTASFSFATTPGQSYTVQQCTNLVPANWVTLTNFTAAGASFQCTMPIVSSSRAFFRVLQP